MWTPPLVPDTTNKIRTAVTNAMKIHRLVIATLKQFYQTQEKASHYISSYRQNKAQWSIWRELQSVWKCNEILSPIDQFRHVKIQSQTIDLRARLWGINLTNSVFIPQSLVLRSIVWGWILTYRRKLVYCGIFFQLKIKLRRTMKNKIV